ncbi:uncharacterized protein LOC129287038 [Prosopis cineraria]|uniref:uncharacterized protein LOC129287038 n=1 Tax=Prosopis cineraria TaxID=364024 RepID=UPI002410B399|nr:uncharacterized protein LOC129287038 [Prosopis cineraria]
MKGTPFYIFGQLTVEGRDEQMKFSSSKAHAVTKKEPHDLYPIQVAQPFGKTETLDLIQKEKAEPFGRRKPLDFSNESRALKEYDQPLIQSSTFKDKERRNLLLQLSHIRDLIRLLLNYPVKKVHDSQLKAWIREASNRKHSLQDLNRLLSQKPLKCFQGLLPIDILEIVETGWSWSSIYGYYYGIPQDILSLAAKLAVDQLVQTLLSEDDHARDIHHILLSTGDAAEKRLVMEKVESVLKDNEVMLRLHETFNQVILIDASNYQSQAEVHVRQQIAQHLQLPAMMEGNDDLLKTSIEKEMSSKRYLVLLVDRDADEEPLDPRKMGFPETQLPGVVVLITSESPKQVNDELI